MTRWLTDTEQRAWRGYLRAQTELMALLSRRMQESDGLSPADFEVLVNLTDAADGRVRVTELARAMLWERSRLSHQLSRMEKRGLIVRQECREDARGAFVALTPAGLTAIEAAAPPHVESVRRLVFDRLTPAQVAALTEISETIRDGLAAETVSPPPRG